MNRKEREKIVNDAHQLWENTEWYYGRDEYDQIPYWDTHDELINERYEKLIGEELQQSRRTNSK